MATVFFNRAFPFPWFFPFGSLLVVLLALLVFFCGSLVTLSAPLESSSVCKNIEIMMKKLLRKKCYKYKYLFHP
jgi:hypothetical protein